MPEYSSVNSPDNVSSAALTTDRIARNGWSVRTPLLKTHVGEQLARPLVRAPHPNPSTINTAE